MRTNIHWTERLSKSLESADIDVIVLSIDDIDDLSADEWDDMITEENSLRFKV